MTLLERDPPGLNHAGWQAMHSALNRYEQVLSEDKVKLEAHKAAIAQIAERIEIQKRERLELIEAMNALRLTVERQR